MNSHFHKKNGIGNSLQLPIFEAYWRGVRVADRASLESLCPLPDRGFESPPLRQNNKSLVPQSGTGLFCASASQNAAQRSFERAKAQKSPLAEAKRKTIGLCCFEATPLRDHAVIPSLRQRRSGN